MSNYEEQWREALKKSAVFPNVDRIVPNADGIKIVYKRKIPNSEPAKYEPIYYTIHTDVAPDMFNGDTTELDRHINAVIKDLEI